MAGKVPGQLHKLIHLWVACGIEASACEKRALSSLHPAQHLDRNEASQQNEAGCKNLRTAWGARLMLVSSYIPRRSTCTVMAAEFGVDGGDASASVEP